VAGPARFRHATDEWTLERVKRDLLRSLENRFGADLLDPRYDPPPSYRARRLEMHNGDLALFAWSDDGAWWLGNTETPETLWRTDKYTFEEAPFPIARWAQRELLADLAESDPWLTDYEYVAWFFLPVLFSKDGRETTRTFFRDHAAGFPDADRDEALAFYENVLKTGVLDDYRYTMASKLGTSEALDLVRMRATMAEFNAAYLLAEAGHALTPEVTLDSGHALDFRVHDHDTLVEVTRPEPPSRRRAGTPAAAIRETTESKTRDQLDAHTGAVLFVDASSFRDDEWRAVLDERPATGYEPSVVYRMRPDGSVQGYTHGRVPLAVTDLLDTGTSQ
jgi:hypothetical protein